MLKFTSTNKRLGDFDFEHKLLERQLIKEHKHFLETKYLKVYSFPIAKYLKYIKKKSRYQQLYYRSHLKYYLVFLWQLTYKILRKKLLSNIISISMNFLFFYLLDNTGLLNILYRKLKKNK